jgi:hypothetical protein
MGLKRASLDAAARLALGRGLRASYKYILKSIPDRLVALMRRLPNHDSRTPRSSFTASTAFGLKSESQSDLCFDPEAVANLQAAVDDGWHTLKEVGNQTITREQLAKRVVELSGQEPRPGMLSAKAIISLIASPARKDSDPTLWPDPNEDIAKRRS